MGDRGRNTQGDHAGRRDAGMSRRALLLRGGALALALTQIEDLLVARGALDEAVAAEPNVVRDTFCGLAAFVVPGPDAYSVAQGEHAHEPGGVDAGAPAAVIETLDAAAPPVPVAVMVAGMLNSTALEVAPAASGGLFASPFARLDVAQKAEVFRRLEADSHPGHGSPLGYLAAVVIGLVAGHVYSDAPVLDRERQEVTRRPVGWDLSHYGGPSDGEAELVGYWKGRRRARTSAAYGGRRRRRARRRRRHG